MKSEVIWITGSSSGIGRALALKLARQGNQVFASARNAEALLALSKESQDIVPLPCDVTDNDTMKQAAERIQQTTGFINRIIVNAGTCEYFDLENPDWSMMSRVMNTNYFGTINTVAQALPLLHQAPDSNRQIVAVASLARVVPFPRAEAYGASKAAMAYFFDALRIDLSAQQINVTVIDPGFVDTPLTQVNDFPMPTMIDVDTAVQIICSRLEAIPLHISFPKRLAIPLKLFALFPHWWNQIAIKKLSRVSATDK